MGYNYEKDLEETIPEFTGYFIPTHLTQLMFMAGFNKNFI